MGGNLNSLVSPSASAGSGTPIGAISSEDSAKAAADEAKAGGNGSFMEKGMLLL